MTALTYRSKKQDGSTVYDCPKCDGRGKLEITPNGKLWFCHKCQVGGKHHPGSGPKKVLENTQRPKGFGSPHHYELITKPQDPRYRYLLVKRGLTHKMVDEMRPCNGGPWYVVYFPLYRFGKYDEPVYFVGRSIFDDHPKYRNPPMSGFPLGGKSKNVWGLHRLCKSARHLVLCEGVFDAVWERNRLALMGKNISEDQVEIIHKIEPREITVFLDNDAQRDAILVCKILSKRVSCSIWNATPPTGKDPDDLGKGFDVKKCRIRIA